MPMSSDQLRTCARNQFGSGWCAITTHPATTSTGRNAIRKTFSESRGQPHFVQPPRICENAITRPAAAISP